MKFIVVSVRDKCIGFTGVMLSQNEVSARRDFRNYEENNPHPEDYDLYQIGEFDTSTGTLVPITPVMIQAGTEYCKM